MSAAQAVVVVSLLAQMYGVDQALMQCIVERESNYATDAVNGVHVGLVQWRPETRAWLAGKAQDDPAWLHGDIGQGPVQDVALAAFWIARGMGSHWATFLGCGGEG